MRSSVIAPLALLATGAAAADCAKGLYIVVARGSEEAAGPGITGTLADEVVDQIKGSEIDAVVYPATLLNYQISVIDGSKAMEKIVTDYAKACPDGKIALMGYSQGAHAALNTVCGSEQNGFANLTALPSDIVEKNSMFPTRFLVVFAYFGIRLLSVVFFLNSCRYYRVWRPNSHCQHDH